MGITGCQGWDVGWVIHMNGTEKQEVRRVFIREAKRHLNRKQTDRKTEKNWGLLTEATISLTKEVVFLFGSCEVHTEGRAEAKNILTVLILCKENVKQGMSELCRKVHLQEQGWAHQQLNFIFFTESRLYDTPMYV